MNNIRYQFITPEPPYYGQTVQLRYGIFYKSSVLPLSTVLDDKENIDYHLAAIINDSVVGYIRMTISDGSAQFSQFFIVEEMRGHSAIRPP